MREALNQQRLKDLYGQIAQRYDAQHTLLTFRADQRGRRMLVDRAVGEGDEVLDCGAGTGSTGILAGRKVGPGGKVTLFDLSEDMLAVAREKVSHEGLQDRFTYQSGDMAHLPFADDRFDVVLSTYSLCPLHDPAIGALELYRVVKPGGRVGIAHSTEPPHGIVRWLAHRIEDLAWRLPRLSMGCRSVHVLPALEEAGGKVLLRQHIGVPLWPFLVAIIEKPTT